jgi:hypothetical protein
LSLPKTSNTHYSTLPIPIQLASIQAFLSLS